VYHFSKHTHTRMPIMRFLIIKEIYDMCMSTDYNKDKYLQWFTSKHAYTLQYMTLILHYWSHLPPLLLVIKAASWRLHCQRWGPLLLTDLLCKIPHHNVFATYIIHIYGLFCGRESYVHIWCTREVLEECLWRWRTTPKVGCYRNLYISSLGTGWLSDCV